MGRTITDLEGTDLIDTPTSPKRCSTASAKWTRKKNQWLRTASTLPKDKYGVPGNASRKPAHGLLPPM